MNRSARMGMGAWGARWSQHRHSPLYPHQPPLDPAARRMEGDLAGADR